MKKSFLTLFLLPLALFAEKFEVETVFTPAVVTAGEPVEIVLISNKRGDLKFDLPEIKGGRWLRNYVSTSTQTSIVNGVVSTSVRRTIPVMTEKPGVITIPSFTVTCGRETARTRELVIKVLSSADRPESSGGFPSPEPTGVMDVPAMGRKFYAGEDIPLVLSLRIPAGTEVRELSYPEITGLGSGVLADFSKSNPRSRFFAPPTQRRRVIGNQECTEVIFRTAFRGLKPETIVPEAVATLGIVHRSRSRTPRSMFDDDFFDGFFSGSSARVVPRQVHFKFEGGKLDILPLPPPPAGADYLKLVGPWRIDVKLGSASARVGEPVELVVNLTGGGQGETLEAPRLNLAGFRVYPPEVKRFPDRIEIKYALIPLETGEWKFAPAFSVFDPVAGRYEVCRRELILPVSPGSAAPAVTVSSAVPAAKEKAVPAVEPEKAKTAPERQELFYQKSAPGRSVELPLVRNQLPGIVCVLVMGIAGGILLKLRSLRREREKSDTSFRRRNELHHHLKDVIAELKTAGFSGEKVRETAVPFLAESMGFAPGATPGELAEKIGDRELADWLRTLNSSGFSPGSSDDDAAPTPRRVKSLLRALKRCGVILFILAGFALQAGFNSAFDRGDYAQAEREYAKFNTRSRWSANALYNLGAVHFMKNDLPRARLCFMRALLLAPWDAETLENLNFVNRKLMQPEVGSTATPGELLVWCRDRLRPDQYVFLASVFAAFLLILAGWGAGGKAVYRNWAVGIFASLLLLAAVAAGSQMAGPYSRDRAVVVAGELKLRTLPAAAGKVETTLPGGGTAQIVDARDGWSRIKINGRDGWVESFRIERIFPEGLW